MTGFGTISTGGETFLLSLAVTTAFAAAFVVGAVISLKVRYPEPLKGDIAAFSGGIFFSTLSFILIDEAIAIGSFSTMAIGFVAGATIFGVTSRFLKKRQRPVMEGSEKSDTSASSKQNEGDGEQENKPRLPNAKKAKARFGDEVVIAKLMDSVPKALFIGVILALDLRGLSAAVAALFLGNVTATMEGARRMQEGGQSKKAIMKNWLNVFGIVALLGPIGYFLSSPLSNAHLSIIIGFAAGDLIAFILGDLVPEAYRKAKWHTGISAALGFLLGVAIFHFAE